jgi:DNA-binding response OmpR family regulator
MASETGTRIRKVVCVDDDGPPIELLTLILKRSGFEGLSAQSGQEGLDLIASAKPDLVLLDIMMPGMNGWEVYQRMKSDETMKTIPVIVVTCLAQEIDKTLALNIARVNDYITKPFEPSKLEASINRVLGIADGNS